MSKTNKQPKPVSGSESKRQEEVNANIQALEMQRVTDPLQPLDFEKVNTQIDFWDFNKEPKFTGVFLGEVEPQKLKGSVYLFSEYNTHELYFVPSWHSLSKLLECENLCETVYMIEHKSVKEIGNNQTYHVCALHKAKQLVPSRYDEIPDEI